MNTIEQRPLTPWKTSTGIVVGGAYTRRPAAMSADAEQLQGALLRHPVTGARGFDITAAGHRWVLIVAIACAAALAAMAIGGWL